MIRNNCVFLLIMVLVIGCGQKVEPNRPLEDIKAEVTTLSREEISGKMHAYSQAILKKRSHFDKRKQAVEKMPVGELLGEKGIEIKAEFRILSQEIVDLNKRYQVYLNAYREKQASW